MLISIIQKYNLCIWKLMDNIRNSIGAVLTNGHDNMCVKLFIKLVRLITQSRCAVKGVTNTHAFGNPTIASAQGGYFIVCVKQPNKVFNHRCLACTTNRKITNTDNGYLKLYRWLETNIIKPV